MRRYTVVLGLLVGCGGGEDPVEVQASQSALAVTPASDRSGTDFDGDGTVDALGIENSTGDFFGLCIDEDPFDPGEVDYEEKRLGFEFDLAGVAPGSVIASATFTLTQSVPGSFVGPKVFEVYGYSGDGAVELADFTADELAAGPFVIDDQEAPIELDVTASVQARVDAGDAFAGFILRHAAAPDADIGFCSLAAVRTSNFADPAGHPRLDIEVGEAQSPIEALIETVEGMDLHAGLENALTSKLRNAQAKLDDGDPGNDHAAANMLRAFINQVEAQRGKKLTEDQADQLIAEAQAIIDGL